MNLENLKHPSRIREAERLARFLPDTPFKDRLKVAEVALSTYGRQAQETRPVGRGLACRRIAAELKNLASQGEEWAAVAAPAYEEAATQQGTTRS